MLSALSMYPIVMALSLIEAALLFFIFRKKNDASAHLWICASVMYCLALGVLLTVNATSPFTRYFLGNLFASYSGILFVYSILQLFSVEIKWKIFDAVFCISIALVVFLLVKLDLSTFVGTAAGLSYGLLNTYGYFRLSTANKAKNLGLKLFSYILLALAIVWFVRVPLSLKYELKFAIDTGLVNYILLFLIFLLTMGKQVGYLTLRISLNFNEKISAATKFSEAVQAQMLKSLTALSLARDNETGNHIIRT